MISWLTHTIFKKVRLLKFHICVSIYYSYDRESAVREKLLKLAQDVKQVSENAW